MTPETLLPFFLVLVPLVGVFAQWLAWRLKIPSILLLLVFGICLGTWISPDTVLAKAAGTDESLGPKLLFPIVSLSVAIILFEGGLTLRWNQLGSSAPVVFRLITISSVITWIATAVLAKYLLGFSWQLAWLLGAVLMVTGPTVVGPLLRQIRPNRQTSSILQWEGILIDPVGAVAAVLVYEVIAHSEAIGPGEITAIVIETLLIGVVIGCVAAALLIISLRKFWIPDFLHGVVFLVVALATFWLSNWMREESGLVTVTILGICLANQKYVSVEHVLEFKEHLRVLLISCLFIVLGSRLQLSSLAEIGWMGVPFVLALVLAVRPISVFLGTIGSKWNIRERTFVGFVAPRGIVAASVASVFGLKLASVGHAEELDVVFAKADLLVPVTFLTILGTVLICGMGAGPLARKLRLADANPQGILFAGASRWAREFATTLKAAGIRSVLVDTNFGNVTAARMAGLTATCGNILSEHVRDEQDLAGIGRFLAVTPSDEVNTLATMELMHLFTRAEVYQISSGGKQHSRWESIPENRRGRTLFSSDITHRQLDAMLDAGAVIKLTLLTKEFPMSAFEQRHGQGMIPIAAITEEGQLRLRVASRALDPLPGESIVAIVPSPSAEKTLDSSSSTAEQDADNQENDLI